MAVRRHFIPGVILLLWAPAKPAAKPDKTRAELAASAAKEYAAKFEEILSQAGAGDASVGPSLALHSWRCFLARWLGALSAAADKDMSEPGQVLSSGRKPVKYTACLHTMLMSMWLCTGGKAGCDGTSCLGQCAGSACACHKVYEGSCGEG